MIVTAICIVLVTILVKQGPGSTVHAAKTEKRDLSEVEIEKVTVEKAFANNIATEYNILFDEGTSYKIVSVEIKETQEMGDALILTNVEKNMVTKDIFLFIGDGGPMKLNPSDAYKEENIRDGSSIPYPYNENYIVHGTAVYNLYYSNLSTYSHPVGAYYKYYKNSPCNVSKIAVEYITDGFEYSYPGFVSLGSVETSYSILVNKTNPINNVVYSNTQPYASNKVLLISNGSLFVGQFLTFECIVDGITRTATIQI